MKEIQWAGLSEFDGNEKDRAEARLERLADGHNDLIDLRISGQGTGHHRHGGQRVCITCHAGTHKIVAARTEPDQGLALNEALDVFEREVHRMREKVRDLRRVRAPEPPDLGSALEE